MYWRFCVFGSDWVGQTIITWPTPIHDPRFSESPVYICVFGTFSSFSHVMPYKKYYPKPYYNKKSLNWDKILVNNSGALTGNTQSNTLLYTAEEAGVLKGLRVNGAIRDTASAAAPSCYWVITVIKEGYTPNAINTGNGVLYAPEQDVWAFGTGIASFETATGDSWIYQFDVSPKTRRRIKKGDKLYLSIICTQNASAIITTQAFFGQ